MRVFACFRDGFMEVFCCQKFTTDFLCMCAVLLCCILLFWLLFARVSVHIGTAARTFFLRKGPQKYPPI